VECSRTSQILPNGGFVTPTRTVESGVKKWARFAEGQLLPQKNFVTRSLRLVTRGVAPSHLCSEQNNSIHNYREIVRYLRFYPTQYQATNERREKENPRILSQWPSHAHCRASTISKEDVGL
jgi:hypothetical protein